jgi:hypothetical protein
MIGYLKEEENILGFQTHEATRGVVNFYIAGVVNFYIASVVKNDRSIGSWGNYLKALILL